MVATATEQKNENQFVTIDLKKLKPIKPAHRQAKRSEAEIVDTRVKGQISRLISIQCRL